MIELVGFLYALGWTFTAVALRVRWQRRYPRDGDINTGVVAFCCAVVWPIVLAGWLVEHAAKVFEGGKKGPN